MWLLLVIYIAFISLGLPDSMLGSAWPSMHKDLNIPESYAGTVTAIIYTGTIISSLACGPLTKRFSDKTIIAASILLTAVAMYGFSISENFQTVCMVALPYGLGGGCIDATLNNYVALHFKAKHMNFLHCFWGIGTIIGPTLMGSIIAAGGVWSESYRLLSILQLLIAVIAVVSFPLWKTDSPKNTSTDTEKPLSDYRILLRPGIRGSILAFFFYCAVETSLGLWTVSYMIEVKQVATAAATAFGMIFFTGITTGRITAGMIADRLSDNKLIRYGIATTIIALMIMIISDKSIFISYTMILIAGIGCGPIFPCMLHRSPDIIGEYHSQTLIGAQMAMASLGSIIIPALFGCVVHHFDISFLPIFCITMIIGLTLSLYIECPVADTGSEPGN